MKKSKPILLCGLAGVAMFAMQAVSQPYSNALPKAGSLGAVTINFNGTNATISNPYAGAGVEITQNGAHVTVTSTTEEEVEYILSGTTTDGCFKMYNAKKYLLTLNGVNITNRSGAAINCQGKKKTTIQLADGTTNTLTDASAYSTASGEDEKGAVFSEGKIQFEGNTGVLNVVANYKHAIAADDEIEINGGVINISNAANDAFHAKNGWKLKGGNVTLQDNKGDGVDCDEGQLEVRGGSLNIRVNQNAGKGLKSVWKIFFNGGSTTINTSGAATVTNGDVSYCTAVKGDSIIYVNDGTLNITSTGMGGRGISSDMGIEFNGGSTTISTSGGAAKYTNASNKTDSYSAACVKADQYININAGYLSCTSSGTAGKGISSDGTLVIGTASTSPTVIARTTGVKMTVASNDYANPKAIKSAGNLTVNNGDITVSTTRDGGEGLESKQTLTVNGGKIIANTYDDGLNAARAIVVNGGYIYSYASNNDGIDSNGTFTFTGGVTIASGAATPEEGFDCDSNTFKITGGVLIGIGGASSTPTASVCTQRSVLFQMAVTQNQAIRVQNSNGTEVLTFKSPRTLNQCTILVSAPGFTAGGTYNVLSGGTISGGTSFNNCYYTGASYSGGSTATSFTTTNMVTNAGGGGGGFNPGGPGGGGTPPGGGGNPPTPPGGGGTGGNPDAEDPTYTDGNTYTYSLKELWTTTNVPASLDARQATVANHCLYIQDKANQTIHIYDVNGKKNETLPNSGQGTNITSDEAGNILVRNGGVFPNVWGAGQGFKVYPNGTNNNTRTFNLAKYPTSRQDFIGRVKGDVLGSGGLLGLSSSNDAYVYFNWVENGTVTDSGSGWGTVSGANCGYISHYGGDYYLFCNNRSTCGIRQATVVRTGTMFAFDEETILTVPGRKVGSVAFDGVVLSGEPFVAYSTGNNYLDGFAIAHISADANNQALVSVNENTGLAANAYQTCWVLFDKVSEHRAYVYRYFPGGSVTCYQFTLTNSNSAEKVQKEELKAVAESGEIRIVGGAPDSVSIYTLGGASVVLNAVDTTYSVANGIYVVVLNGKAQKVIVK